MITNKLVKIGKFIVTGLFVSGIILLLRKYRESKYGPKQGVYTTDNKLERQEEVKHSSNQVIETNPKLGDGFLYPIINWIFKILRFICLSHIFTIIERRIRGDKIGYAIDIYILLSWAYLVSIWFTNTNHWEFTFSVWYLIITNVYMYFYYHIWDDEALDTSTFNNDRIKRRFLYLITAVIFSISCFAYLYQIPYSNEYCWPKPGAGFKYATLYSISSALAANYGSVVPKTEENFGNTLPNIELLISFVFITIIISRSIPQK